MTVSLEDIRQAATRIKPYAHRTPVLTNESLNQQVGAQVYLKCENLQKVGAFKFRGASNAVWSLTDEEAARGVVTHSSGNHAQALALAAKMRGIPAYIVMPSNAPQVKKNAVAGYGGQITFCEPTLEARESTMERIRSDTGATVVHPYDNKYVIAGQGTAALELLEDVSDLDVIIAPVGGGGLLSGTSIAATETQKGIRVIAASPDAVAGRSRSAANRRHLPSGIRCEPARARRSGPPPRRARAPNDAARPTANDRDADRIRRSPSVVSPFRHAPRVSRCAAGIR